jgi:hypothetical protein
LYADIVITERKRFPVRSTQSTHADIVLSKWIELHVVNAPMSVKKLHVPRAKKKC